LPGIRLKINGFSGEASAYLPNSGHIFGLVLPLPNAGRPGWAKTLERGKPE